MVILFFDINLLCDIFEGKPRLCGIVDDSISGISCVIVPCRYERKLSQMNGNLACQDFSSKILWIKDSCHKVRIFSDAINILVLKHPHRAGNGTDTPIPGHRAVLTFIWAASIGFHHIWKWIQLPFYQSSRGLRSPTRLWGGSLYWFGYFLGQIQIASSRFFASWYTLSDKLPS